MATVHVNESINSNVQRQLIAETPQSTRSLASQSAICSKDHHNPPSSGGKRKKSDDKICVTIEVDVDPKYHNIFFRNRGKLIQKIYRKSGGVLITFPPVGSTSSKVLLRGRKKFVNAAKLAFSEVVAELESHAVIPCIIPPRYHSGLIGRKGVKIQALCRQHGVYIEFPKRAVNSAAGVGMGTGDRGNNGSTIKDATDLCDPILIRGKEDDCLEAREALLDSIATKIAVDVPFRLHRAIASRRDTHIRPICNKYRVSIQIPRPELQRDCVYVRGPASSCKRAKKALLNQVKHLQGETNPDPQQDDNVSAPRATFASRKEAYWLGYTVPSLVLCEL